MLTRFAVGLFGEQLDDVSAELFRVLKPGARFSCQEYLLTPHFNWENPRHVELHKLFLPTLAVANCNINAKFVLNVVLKMKR